MVNVVYQDVQYQVQVDLFEIIIVVCNDLLVFCQGLFLYSLMWYYSLCVLQFMSQWIEVKNC